MLQKCIKAVKKSVEFISYRNLNEQDRGLVFRYQIIIYARRKGEKKVSEI